MLFYSHGFCRENRLQGICGNGSANALGICKMKNIFLLFLFTGVRGWDRWPCPWILIRYFSITFLAKSVVFVVLRRKNKVSPLLASPWNDFMATSGKSADSLENPLVKILPTPMFLNTVDLC